MKMIKVMKYAGLSTHRVINCQGTDKMKLNSKTYMYIRLVLKTPTLHIFIFKTNVTHAWPQ